VGQAARKSLIDYVTSKYLADAAAVKSLTPSTWIELTWNILKDASADTKTAWAAKIRAAYIDDAAVLGQLPLSEVRSLSRVMGTLADPQPSAVVAKWVQATTSWQTLKTSDLVPLVNDLATLGDAGQAARGQVTGFLSTRYLADANGVRSVGANTWGALASALGKTLAADTKSSWIAKLRGAYVDDTAALGALNLGEIQDVARALRELGDAQADVVVAAWFEKTNSWQSLKTADLASLAKSLTASGTAGQAARAKLGDYMIENRLAQPTPGLLKDLLSLSDLSTNLKASPDARKQWIARVWAQYGGDAVLGLKLDELEAVCEFLGRMGDGHGPYLAAHFIEKSGVWQTWDNPNDLLRLLRLVRGDGAKLQAVRLLVAEHLGTKYLQDQGKMRALGAGGIQGFVELLKGDLSSEKRKTWAPLIHAAFAADSSAAQSMKLADLRNLIRALEPLDAKDAAALALSRIADPLARANLAPEDLVDLARSAAKGNPVAIAPSLGDIENVLVAADNKAPLPLATVGPVREFYVYAAKKDKAGEWLMRAYSARLGTDTARKSADLAMLWWFAEQFELTGLVGKGKGYPAYAAALAQQVHGGGGPAEGGIPTYALPLGTPETRGVIQDELLDADGNPRLVVAKLLTWAYFNAGELKSWHDQIETKIGGSQGDTKALWLAVQGYVESLAPKPLNPAVRIPRLTTALSAVTTEQCKLVILNEFAEASRAQRQFTQTIDLLESVKSQFGADSARAVEGLQAGLRREEADRQAAAERVQAAAKVAQIDSQLKHHRERLAAAQAAGDSATVVNLQTAIDACEKQLMDVSK
jgi:hypothetical protein